MVAGVRLGVFLVQPLLMEWWEWLVGLWVLEFQYRAWWWRRRARALERELGDRLLL